MMDLSIAACRASCVFWCASDCLCSRLPGIEPRPALEALQGVGPGALAPQRVGWRQQPQAEPDQGIAAAGDRIAEADRLAGGVLRLEHIHEALRHLAPLLWWWRPCPRACRVSSVLSGMSPACTGIPAGEPRPRRSIPRLDLPIRIGREILGRVAHLVSGGRTDIDAAAGPLGRPDVGLLHRKRQVAARRRHVVPLAQPPRAIGSAMPCWLSGIGARRPDRRLIRAGPPDQTTRTAAVANTKAERHHSSPSKPPPSAPTPAPTGPPNEPPMPAPAAAPPNSRCKVEG